MAAVAEQRDREAFAQLLRYFAPRVRAYLMRGGASQAQVDEVVQEAMLTVWSQAGRYDATRGNVSTWVYAIARNRWIDRVRKNRRPTCDPDDPAWVPSTAPAPDAAVAVARRRDRVAAVLAVLPSEQATIVRQAYFEGKSQRQIAEQMGIPIGTVKSRVRLALARLRDELGWDHLPDMGVPS